MKCINIISEATSNREFPTNYSQRVLKQSYVVKAVNETERGTVFDGKDTCVQCRERMKERI